MQGWIKLHRELINKPIWLKSSPEQKAILITLLLMANHQEQEWEWQGIKFKVQPGQFVTSLEHIANQSGKGVTFQNVRTSLKKFENKYQFLTSEATKTGTLITICNWGDYQDREEETNKDANNELTKNQQRGNKELTTNKNGRMEEWKNERTNSRTQGADKSASKLPTKATAKTPHLFTKSAYYYSPELFKQEVVKANPQFYSKYDLDYYFNAILNWSEKGKGNPKKDWIATARNFINRDYKKGQGVLDAPEEDTERRKEAIRRNSQGKREYLEKAFEKHTLYELEKHHIRDNKPINYKGELKL